MIQETFFQSKAQAEALIKGKIIAVITEYTIFKLDLDTERVIFKCLQDMYNFDIPFKVIQDEIRATAQDFSQAFLQTLVTYCAVASPQEEKRAYPLCEFENIDALLDWFLDWMKFDETARLDYLEDL